MSIKVIGLTGQTGSGKSSVCEYLKGLNFVIIDSDKITRNIHENAACKMELIEFFGKEIINESGKIDRKVLSQKAFSDDKSLKKLNQIIHPKIIIKIKDLILKYKNEAYRGIILDAPLLFESGVNKLCSDTLAVLSDEKIRLERIIKRDNLNEESAKIRISAQNNNEYFIKKADKYILNNNDLNSLFNEINEVLKEWRI